MALPNDQFNQTEAGAGSPTPLASHVIEGKEYPVVLVAGASGHLKDTLDTFYVWANDVAFANNKHFLSILNASGSGKLVKVRKLFLINLQLAAVTGVAVRFNVQRITAHSGGTLITPEAADTTNAALPSQITARTGSSVTTTGGILFSHASTNDEVGATNAFPTPQVQAGLNLMPEGDSIQDIRIREGQGLTVQCVTSTTIGLYGVLAVITVE